MSGTFPKINLQIIHPSHEFIVSLKRLNDHLELLMLV